MTDVFFLQTNTQNGICVDFDIVTCCTNTERFLTHTAI